MATKISSIKDFLSRDSTSLADSWIDCTECGRIHSIPVRSMKVGFDLLSGIPGYAKNILRRAPNLVCVIYDQAIEPIIHNQVSIPLERAGGGLHFDYLPVGKKDLLLDSDVKIGDEVAERIKPRVDLIIGAGSGVICDLTKWVATRRNLPYILFATAPSMNAYSSITATMTEADIKTSRLLNPASVVLMDIGLQASAPMEMIYAGLGDLAARAICNADWKMASYLHGTYFCSIPYQMTAENEKKYLCTAGSIRLRDQTAITHLSEALLISGLSMTMLDGETSPSSGAEHVISHFWDLLTHVRGLPKNLHGSQVGVGTVIMLAFYKIIRGLDIHRIDPLTLLRNRQSVESIEAENNYRYSTAAPLFNAVVRKKRIPDDQFCDYIRDILVRWDTMWESVGPYTTSLESIQKPLLDAGMPLTLSSVNRTTEEAVEALIKGPQYRSRYTLLDLASELGLLPEIATEVLHQSGVLG
jgi:glycerol-1-phosphate dehydrogenase [NAD(P)+]